MTQAKSKKPGTKQAHITRIKKDEIVQSVGGLSLGGVAEQLARTQVAVQEKLTEVSGQMSAALAQLGDVNEAIVAKKEELRTLHEIEVTALSLDELTGAIQTTREGWAAEQTARERAEAERNSELQKARAREAEEYAYRTAQERRKTEAEYAERVATERRTHAERAEALEKEWAKREADLKAREQELAALRDAVAKYPDELKRAVAAEVAVATTALKKQLETAAALDKKDAETNLKLANNATAAAQAEVARLQATITDLNRQLADAHRATQTVAEKALDSASGRTAMEALQQTMGRNDAPLPTSRR